MTAAETKVVVSDTRGLKVAATMDRGGSSTGSMLYIKPSCTIYWVMC